MIPKLHDALKALSHGAIFPGNLQRNSTLKRCQISDECLICLSKTVMENVYLPILHLPTVE